MEQEAYRHVPYDIDVEQALLGAIPADNRAMERASALVKPEHFYDPLHGRIYETMSHMIERGGVELSRPPTLHATMKSDPGVIETGGQAYFDALRAAAPPFPMRRTMPTSCRTFMRRSLIRIGEDIVNTAYDAPTEKTSREQIAEAEKALYAVAETTNVWRRRAGISRGAAAARWSRPSEPMPGAAASRASPPASPISTRCWAACSLPTC